MVVERPIRPDDGYHSSRLTAWRRHLWHYWWHDGWRVIHSQPLYWTRTHRIAIDVLSSASDRGRTTSWWPEQYRRQYGHHQHAEQPVWQLNQARTSIRI